MYSMQMNEKMNKTGIVGFTVRCSASYVILPVWRHLPRNAPASYALFDVICSVWLQALYAPFDVICLVWCHASYALFCVICPVRRHMPRSESYAPYGVKCPVRRHASYARLSVIYLISKLLHAYARILFSRLWQFGMYATYSIVGAALFRNGLPHLLAFLGFDKSGVRGKSYASDLMSMMAQLNGGKMSGGNVVCQIQRISMLGLGKFGKIALSILGALTGCYAVNHLWFILWVTATTCLLAWGVRMAYVYHTWRYILWGAW